MPSPTEYQKPGFSSACHVLALSSIQSCRATRLRWAVHIDIRLPRQRSDLPKLMIYQQPDLPAPLKWQAIAFLKTEWPFIFSGDDIFLTDPYPPEQDTVHFVAAEGNSLISYASAFRLTLDHADTAYEVYGFGNMFTFPPYRRRGYGRRVLELATDFIRRSDVDVAILFCDSQLEPFYAACGWEGVPSPTRIGTQADYEVHEGSKMMLAVSEKGQRGKLDFAEQPLYVEWPW